MINYIGCKLYDDRHEWKWSLKRRGWIIIPDNKVHGVNMGPTWGRQDPGGPHVGHMNLAIWDYNEARAEAFFIIDVWNKFLENIHQKNNQSWWCHDMEMLSVLLALCEGNPPVIDGFPSQKADNMLLWCFLWCQPKKLKKTENCWVSYY